MDYRNSLNTLKKDEGAERLAHFPNKITSNAKNYFMQIEHSFDGYDMNYVNFDIDKAYIDNNLYKFFR